MNTLAINKLLLERLSPKVEMDFHTESSRSDKLNIARAYFHHGLALEFRFSKDQDTIEVRCLFENGLCESMDDPEVNIKLVNEYYNGEEDGLDPFFGFGTDYFETEDGEFIPYLFLRSVVEESDFNEEMIGEFVHCLLHPSPYLKKLIQMSNQ